MTDEQIGKVMRRAREKRLTGSELAMLLELVGSMGIKGYCNDTNLQFAKRIGSACERSVAGWLASLQERGFIKIIRIKRHNERRIYVNGVDFVGKYVADEKHLSPAQQLFHDEFPNKEIDCEVPDYVNMQLLINKIKESKFLTTADNMSLKSFVETHYFKIIDDRYADKERRAESVAKKNAEILRKAMQQLSERKRKAEDEFNQKMKLILADENFKKLSQEHSKLLVANAKKEAYGQTVDEAAEQKLLSEMEKIRQMYGVSITEPAYHCSVCKDTGFVENKKCKCLEELIKSMQNAN